MATVKLAVVELPFSRNGHLKMPAVEVVVDPVTELIFRHPDALKFIIETGEDMAVKPMEKIPNWARVTMGLAMVIPIKMFKMVPTATAGGNVKQVPVVVADSYKTIIGKSGYSSIANTLPQALNTITAVLNCATRLTLKVNVTVRLPRLRRSAGSGS